MSHNALVPVSLQALILISNRKPIGYLSILKIVLKIGALIQQKSEPLHQKCLLISYYKTQVLPHNALIPVTYRLVYKLWYWSPTESQIGYIDTQNWRIHPTKILLNKIKTGRHPWHQKSQVFEFWWIFFRIPTLAPRPYISIQHSFGNRGGGVPGPGGNTTHCTKPILLNLTALWQKEPQRLPILK